MGISAKGFVVALPYVASAGAMVLWARSSDIKGERVWHAALATLVAAAGFVGATLAQSNLLVLVALAFTTVGVLSALSPINCLLKSFLKGPAAASGLALYNSIGNIGGFLGPYMIGGLKEATGGYSAGMAAIAVGLVLSAIIVLTLGRTVAARSDKLMPKPSAAE